MLTSLANESDRGTPPNMGSSDALPVLEPDRQKVALLLNRNARRVNDGLAKTLERIVGRDHFFYSRTLDEAESYCREIVQHGYGTVICGGGDGTLVQAINLTSRYINQSNAWRLERHERYGETQKLLGKPTFAFLPLGTGNGVKRLVGARDAVSDTQRIIDLSPSREIDMPMITDGHDQFFFAGLGYDSVVLNDYNQLRQKVRHTMIEPVMSSVIGYFAAAFVRTIPRILAGRGQQVMARIKTVTDAQYVDPRRGDRAMPIPAGTTLFDGPASMIGVGTCPYFGYGMKVFPFAGLVPEKFQLRIARLGALHTLAKLPSIWTGNYRNSRLLADYIVDDITIELATPYPFEHSGDDQGLKEKLCLRIADEKVKLLDFQKPRPLT